MPPFRSPFHSPFHSMTDPVVSQIGKYDVATIDRGGQQISILQGKTLSLLRLISGGDRSSIVLDNPEGKRVILEGQTAVITPIWNRTSKRILSGRRAYLESRYTGAVMAAVTMTAAIVLMAGVYMFTVDREVSASAAASVQAARQANIERAESLLRELQNAGKPESGIPAVSVTSTVKRNDTGAYRTSAGTDRYGVPDIPPADSWADKSRITLPLPGGGTIRQPGDMLDFGLRP